MKKLYWLTDPSSTKQLAQGLDALRIQNIPVLRWNGRDSWAGSKYISEVFRDSYTTLLFHDIFLIRECDAVFVKLTFGGQEFEPGMGVGNDDYINGFWDDFEDAGRGHL